MLNDYNSRDKSLPAEQEAQEQPHATLPEVDRETKVLVKLADLAEKVAAGEIQHKGVEVAVALNDLKAETKLSLESLRTTLTALLKVARDEAPVSEAFSQAEIDAAQNLLKKENLFSEFHHDFSLTAYRADVSLATSGLLFLGRTLLPTSSSLYAHGKSSSGKTEFLLETVKFFPQDRVQVLTKITPRWLYRAGGHDARGLAGKILLFGELNPVRPGEDDQIQEAVRQFVSDNKLSLGSVDDVAGQRNTATTHLAYGPVTIAFTGTRSPSDWDDQMVNRSFCRHFKHDQQSIKSVLESKASSGAISTNPAATDNGRLAAAQRKWRAAFAQLRRHDANDSSQIQGIEIPFLGELIFRKKRLTEPDMRAFDLLKNCIAVSTLLHQATRDIKKQDSKDILVANWQDFANVEAAFLDMVPRTSQGLSNDLIDIFLEKLLPWWQEPANKSQTKTKIQIASALGAEVKTADRWIRSWISSDLLEFDHNTTRAPSDRKNYYRLAANCESLAKETKESGDPKIGDGCVPPEYSQAVDSKSGNSRTDEPADCSSLPVSDAERSVSGEKSAAGTGAGNLTPHDFSPTAHDQLRAVETQASSESPSQQGTFSPATGGYTYTPPFSDSQNTGMSDDDDEVIV